MPSIQKTDVALSEIEARRLAWRCRRGLLELDIVLQRFVAASFKTLTNQELFALDALLELPDNDFWALLSTESTTSLDLETTSVIRKIKSMHQER